jgi:hypothetical protein
MRAIFEHYDVNRPDYILPQACNPNYASDEFHRPLTFDDHMWNTLRSHGPDSWRKDQLHPFINIPLVHISDIRPNEEYLYIIMIYNVKFFQENRDQGFKYIDKSIIEDIDKGRCKLYLCMAWEGTSGERGCGSNTSDDFAILQQWCNQAKFNTSNVYYVTPNLLGESTAKKHGATYNVITCPSQEVWTWHSTNSAGLCDIPKYEPMDNANVFLTYNRRPRDHRIILLAELQRQNCFNRGIVSFNPFNLNSRRKISDIERIHNSDVYNNFIENLISGGEIIADRNTSDITNSVGDPSNYRRTFCSIVTETLVGQDTIFFSEKSWRCLSVGHPFLLLSSPGAIAKLKSMGFKTFSNFWDEDYDNESNLILRIKKIVNIIKDLSGRDDLEELRHTMGPILEYNKKHFEDRVHRRFYRENKNFVNNHHVFTPLEEHILGISNE